VLGQGGEIRVDGVGVDVDDSGRGAERRIIAHTLPSID
jgi:hypothetical protein